MTEDVREFLLPDLGEGLEDAEIMTWHVAAGDRVELNQVLVEVNTAKALVEIPSPWEGTVERVNGAEGDVVKVGQPLVAIRVGAASSGATPGEASRAPKRRPLLVGYGVVEEDDAPRRVARARAAPGDEGGGPVPASPPVRRLAKDLGIELSAVPGSGPGGRVTRDDVLKASARRPPAESGAVAGEPETQPRPAQAGSAEDREIVPVRGVRRMIAEKMTRSVQEIPHVTVFQTIDATHLLAFRDHLTAGSGDRLSPLPIVVRALAETCREHPGLNASFSADRSEITLFRRVHAGIATDTDRGLLVTVVRDAGDRGILDIAREIARLSEAARAGTARPEELAGSTVTVSNVGTFGSESGTPIINHPEAAVLALGVIEPRALVVDRRVEARPATTLSLSFDHRVMDGAQAGRALRALGNLLTNPFSLGALPR